MRCALCLDLEAAFEARRNEYIEASSLAYFRVSKKFAAYMNVEMERALIELEDHRSACLSAMNQRTGKTNDPFRTPIYRSRRAPFNPQPSNWS